MFVFMVCLVLAAVSAEAEVVLGLPALYNNYHGEYAASYDNYEPRPYAFEYGVSDPHTGDHKTQWETKDKAGVVRGSYSLLEPDGTTRIVDYIADDHGFRAVVKKIGIHGQSVESHGGAAEQSGLVQPIVVPEIEPASIHLQQPAQIVSQSVSLEPQLRVQEQIPLHQQQIQQAPLFQSYDGGVEHYQTLVQHQLPYNLPVPKAEGIYVETPKNDFGYLQSYEPLPYLKGVNYGQQIPEAPRQEIRFQQQTAPVAPISSGGLYYTQQTEIGNPQGKSIITFQQPQQLIVAQEKPIAAANLQENVIYQNQLENQYLQQNQKLIEPYQNQRYALQNERLIEPHQSQLPVQSYQLQLNYPGENQIVQSYGESSQNQGVQGITGNLEDDSAYTNYDQSNNAQLVLNQGEKFASTKYGAW